MYFMLEWTFNLIIKGLLLENYLVWAFWSSRESITIQFSSGIAACIITRLNVSAN